MFDKNKPDNTDFSMDLDVNYIPIDSFLQKVFRAGNYLFTLFKTGINLPL